MPMPIPPAPGTIAAPTPTWFIEPPASGGMDSGTYSIYIWCPSDSSYPGVSIVVSAHNVEQWAAMPHYNGNNKSIARPNQIYSTGTCGVFGFAQRGPNGLIYTVTAGVNCPQVYPN